MPLPASLQRPSLKGKLALYGTTATLAVVFCVTILALWIVRKDVRQSIIDAQSALLDAVRQDLDEKIADRKRVIALAAEALSGSGLLSWEELANSTTRPLLLHQFDALFVIDRTGRIIYDAPQVPGRRGTSVADREYFKAAVHRGQSVVSGPIQGKTTQEPNILFATPLRAADGEIIGMLGGSVFLSHPNFLGQLADTRIGKQGYFALVSKGDKPTILMHRQSEQILQPAPGAQENPLLWKALAGFEGTVEFVDRTGAEGIYSFRSLESVPWVLLASYPASEAYATLRERERQIVALALVLALFSGAFLWWFSRTLLAPLEDLTDAMQARMEYPDRPAEPIHAGSEELAKVVSMYHALMEHKQASEAALRKSEQKFRSIIDHAGDAFIRLDAQGRVTEWNKQAEQSFGWTRAEAVGESLGNLIMPAEFTDRFTAALQRFAHAGMGAAADYRIETGAIHKSGQHIPVEISVTGVKEDGGFVANAFLRDIRERKAAAERLESSERRLRTVTDNLPMLIGYIDKGQIVRFCNGTSKKWLGLRPEAVINRPLCEVVGTSVYEQIRPNLERALAGEHVKFELETSVRHVSGHVQLVYVPEQAADGSILGVYTLSTDISSLKTVENELSRLARFDSLTGLPNRMHLYEKLTEAIARSRRSKMAIAVMFLDIDHFKSINDTWGHAAGDAVLQQFANRLKSGIRTTDTVGRLAGDEFIILLEGLNFTEEANLVAKKILLAVSEEMLIGDRRILVTTSIGIAYSTTGALESMALLSEADKALYAAKEAGRDTFYMRQSA